ncbi:transmembrane partial [Lentinula edodes]|uniref:Transmembrane partial n=1 Tax=Lentinula edodes TaxID=5353 RepID=A0A1Q3EHB6_LENED|nr:transmembrane partial [Lentinula edodes]
MSENTRSNLSPPRRYDDPSTKIWSLYLDQAEKNNERITESWKGDMDAILIFAGLFSASSFFLPKFIAN